jgi:ribonuclease HI
MCLRPSSIQPKIQPVEKADLYPDGSCDVQSGLGGWACLVKTEGGERWMSGQAYHTTNNRMELTALLEGLLALPSPARVQVHGDSQYLVRAFTENWLSNWAHSGWVTSGRTPVKNRDLWEALLAQCQRHALWLEWVRGHAGHRENEQADQLALQRRRELERNS